MSNRDRGGEIDSTTIETTGKITIDSTTITIEGKTITRGGKTIIITEATEITTKNEKSTRIDRRITNTTFKRTSKMQYQLSQRQKLRSSSYRKKRKRLNSLFQKADDAGLNPAFTSSAANFLSAIAQSHNTDASYLSFPMPLSNWNTILEISSTLLKLTTRPAFSPRESRFPVQAQFTCRRLFQLAHSLASHS